TYSGATGRPNIFQGQQSQPNQVSFAIPFDPPGTGTRKLRITNLRVNASGAQISNIALAASASGQIPLSVGSQVVAPVQPAGTLQVTGVRSGANGLTQLQVTLTERLAAALKTRSAATYTSAESSPTPVNQN